MQSVVTRAIRKLKRACGADGRFPGEIRGDSFAQTIERLASQEKLSTILEIGSSAGGGSTQAFVDGIRKNPSRPTLFCIEVAKDRFALLQDRYAKEGFVKCYNASSVPVAKFASEQQVRDFLAVHWDKNQRKNVEVVCGWLRSEIQYLGTVDVPDNGIELIKRENSIDHFDLVLIDGSEFSGIAELDQVIEARIILLDDIKAMKNHHNCMRLLADENYKLFACEPELRGGFAAFERR